MSDALDYEGNAIEIIRVYQEQLYAVTRQRDELLAGKLIEEPLRRQLAELRDEVEYHRTDAKKWALQALKFDKWQPIETAPKIGKHLATMKNGAVSVIVWLDADHPDADEAGWYEHWHFDPVEPTHWQRLPAQPKVGAGGTATDQPPLQKLGARLAELLDEDQFAECEDLLLAAGVNPYR